MWYAPKNELTQGKKRFGIVPFQFLIDPRINHNRSSQAVFIALCQFADAKSGLVGRFNEKSGKFEPTSLDVIAKVAGISYDNASRAKKLLRDTNWIILGKTKNDHDLIRLNFPEELQVVNDKGQIPELSSRVPDKEYARRSSSRQRSKVELTLEEFNAMTETWHAEGIAKRAGAEAGSEGAYEDIAAESMMDFSHTSPNSELSEEDYY